MSRPATAGADTPARRIVALKAPRMADAPIAAIELHHIALPTRREHKWTGLTEPIGGYVLVKMTDAAGLAGWGEAPALKDWGGEFGRYFGESPGTTIQVITQYLAPAVHGCLPGEIAELHARMDRAIKGYPYAKAAVEFAAYDLAGKQCGLPVHRLLGRRQPAPHPGDAFDRAHRLRGGRARGGAGRQRRHPHHQDQGRRRSRPRRRDGPAHPRDRRAGHRALRATPTRATARRARRSAPSGAWSATTSSISSSRSRASSGLAEVARAIDAPVMADESAWNAHDVIEIIEKRAAQIVSIYTTKPGGLYRAMEVARGRARRRHHLQRQWLGRDRRRQPRQPALAAAAPAAVLSCVVPVSTPAEAQSGQIAGIYYKDDLIAEPMRFVDGAIELPTGPGMGIAVDESKIARYRVGKPITV